MDAQEPTRRELLAARIEGIREGAAFAVETIGRLTGRVHELTEEVERLRRQLAKETQR